MANDDLQAYHSAIDQNLLVEAECLRVVAEAASYALEVGDACSFRANVIHRLENAGTGPCVSLAVVDYAPNRRTT